MSSRGTWGGARVSLFAVQHSIWKSFIEMDDRAGVLLKQVESGLGGTTSCRWTWRRKVGQSSELSRNQVISVSPTDSGYSTSSDG